MEKTFKEAILKSLEEMDKPSNPTQVFNHIRDKRHYDFGNAPTPLATVQSRLGEFISKGDTRVKRIKESKGYSYYLAAKEQEFGIDIFTGEYTETTENPKNSKSPKIVKDIKQTYIERDLHKLLSTYLKSTEVYSKTIFHEKSTGKDKNQIWTHPDMVGIKFLKLQETVSQNFLKCINRADTFKLRSYELKKEINNDSELKEAFFQAVSNSSWANYGYLVAFEFSERLAEEMERLNQSFGIGFIELNANPYQSRILFSAKYRDLDFKTIDKLCKINGDFGKFIGHVEKLMTADEKYFSGVEKELDSFCDGYFKDDTEAEEYCKEKHIPIEQTEE
ncbi:hypothetical protein Barb4_00277 [Bacteroidales bacterium Barb4]|nr:hypothetical protein Barb4_00277 [Bacteroidales bacterium Barb4]